MHENLEFPLIHIKTHQDSLILTISNLEKSLIFRIKHRTTVKAFRHIIIICLHFAKLFPRFQIQHFQQPILIEQ